jgi:hypothetical protein
VFSSKKYKIQNANYFGMMECKMPKILWSYLVLSKIHNLLPLMRASWDSFGLFWPLQAKIQNGEQPFFCQILCMVFSFILQNGESKPKIFWNMRGTKHPKNQKSHILMRPSWKQ